MRCPAVGVPVAQQKVYRDTGRPQWVVEVLAQDTERGGRRERAVSGRGRQLHF
jgi:hypothetical protein